MAEWAMGIIAVSCPVLAVAVVVFALRPVPKVVRFELNANGMHLPSRFVLSFGL